MNIQKFYWDIILRNCYGEERAVRDDIKGLQISRRELQKLTNLPVYEELIIIINPLKKLLNEFIRKVKGSEGVTVIFIGFSILLGSYIIFDVLVIMFARWLGIPSWLLLIEFCAVSGALTQAILYFVWKKNLSTVKSNITNSLQILLEDVERFNSVVKAIDINDKIEAAGNSEVGIKERKGIIEALKFTRADLVRALKTERIFRENKNFIISNTELFTNNLAILTAMQVKERANEHSRLLNEALHIALDVQQEMTNLQIKR